MRLTPLGAALAALALASSYSAQSFLQSELYKDYYFQENEDGSILTADAHGTYVFDSFNEYVLSSFFQEHGLRCGSDRLPQFEGLVTGDCNSSHTSILSIYNPQSPPYVIPVWVHVLMNKRGTLGVVSDTDIMEQIQALNIAFASAGIQFAHPSVTPTLPYGGTTRSKNNTWYNDGGTYYNTLARDVLNNLNIYTNTAGGNLGYAYVPSGGGVVGNKWDRVVIYYPTIGAPAPYGAPYGEGDTTVHEVGHYLGLYHTFQGGCASASNCSNNGDLICDTNPESTPNFSPCTRSSACGAWPDPTDNFMDYSDDVCMYQFTSNQQNRMNCTIENFRTGLMALP
jgi:hypothetical protein